MLQPGHGTQGVDGEVVLALHTGRERQHVQLVGQPHFLAHPDRPGAFGTWLTLLRDHGTWSLADVLAPAIGYAREGFPLVPRIVQAIYAVQALFREQWTSSAAVWLPDGRVPAPGSMFRLPQVADTYERILRTAQAESTTRTGVIDAALRAWYQGFVARDIDHFYRHEQVQDTSGGRNRGLLRYDDLAQWAPTVEAPLTMGFGRYTLAKCGFWSQGPSLLQVRMTQHAHLLQQRGALTPETALGQGVAAKAHRERGLH
ncbi:MAG: gamma-glutamyltransferase family protein, partial [Betaproteobacteria bacterium]|nr:gamma-glutamyltransferase family protein [Betaproteobacteria bacterium]